MGTHPQKGTPLHFRIKTFDLNKGWSSAGPGCGKGSGKSPGNECISQYIFILSDKNKLVCVCVCVCA